MTFFNYLLCQSLFDQVNLNKPSFSKIVLTFSLINSCQSIIIDYELPYLNSTNLRNVLCINITLSISLFYLIAMIISSPDMHSLYKHRSLLRNNSPLNLIMSVYNGFPTREKETSYLKALYNMAFLLQLKLAKQFSGGKLNYISEQEMDDNKFFSHFTKLYKRLNILDKDKHMNPKFSYAFKDLSEWLGIFKNPFDNQSVILNNECSKRTVVERQHSPKSQIHSEKRSVQRRTNDRRKKNIKISNHTTILHEDSQCSDKQISSGTQEYIPGSFISPLREQQVKQKKKSIDLTTYQSDLKPYCKTPLMMRPLKNRPLLNVSQEYNQIQIVGGKRGSLQQSPFVRGGLDKLLNKVDIKHKQVQQQDK